MPYVTIRIIKGTTPEFKAKLIERVPNAVADVIVEDFPQRDKEKVLDVLWCIIEEVPWANWGVHGVGLTPERLRELVRKED